MRCSSWRSASATFSPSRGNAATWPLSSAACRSATVCTLSSRANCMARFGSDARDLHQAQRGLGNARPTLLDRRQRARVQVLEDLGADGLADAVDLLDAVLGSHDLDRLVVVLDARGGVAIVGDAIAVLAEKLHAVGELAQHAGDLAVLHDQLAGAGEHGVEHGHGELAGEGVLLATDGTSTGPCGRLAAEPRRHGRRPVGA